MSSISPCETGIVDAPAMPWISRKMTISGRLVATPHSIEAIVNRAIEASSTRLRPNFWASQPDSGVMIAAAMM